MTVSPTLDAVVATSGSGTTVTESVVLGPPDSGETYYVRAIYFAVVAGAPPLLGQYQGSAIVESGVATPPGVGSCALPTFDNYQPPVGYPRRDDSGEPSIGINWNTNSVMTMSRLRANRTTFNDSTSPADPTTGTTWFSQTSPLIVTGLDPIGFTDPVTGRSIFGELNGAFTNAGISDDDLTTFTPNAQSVGNANGPDHQTIGGGPPNPTVVGRQPIGPYPHLSIMPLKVLQLRRWQQVLTAA